ncbi:MAG: Iron-sulfur assembly protein 1 [Claussenomyces sp. TS43310]|nr:MAG: Iron-sulfur assembly protein 1 [Claussenomyces sp. TS43310]
MSAQRIATPFASSTSMFLRFASCPAASSRRPCQHALRQFSSSYHASQSSKRKMQTSTAYHPYSLDSAPPPPQNLGVPNTSIAASVPQVNDTRPPALPPKEDLVSAASVEQRSSASTAPAETKMSQPVTPPTASIAPSTQQPRAKSRPKLRPRKAAMNLTSRAVEQLRGLLNQPDPKLIRVGVKNRGCSGLAYHLEYVEKPGTFDEAVEQDGVKVLIDSKALFSIIGSEMDYVEDQLSQRFVFKNPNIKEECGCGESFMV